MAREGSWHKHNLVTILLILFLPVICVRAGTYSGGDGSEEYPYRIATPNDLNAIGAHPSDWDANFVMVNDINLADYTGTQFNIIGNESDAFTGVFDGNDHKISNLTYAITDTDYIGLFGCVDAANATIKDLTLTESDVNAGTGYYAGSLLGFLRDGTISGCGVEGGSVGGDEGIGGLVGMNRGTISNCYATGTVEGGSERTGGLVGWNDGTISNCYSTASVLGNGYIGGLVGDNWEMISYCYATGRVQGDWLIGGLVGNNSGTVNTSFWDIQTTSQATSAGAEGKTTAQMQMQSTFTNAGWDFVEIWNIGENQTYPYLRVYPAGDLNHDGRVDFFDFAILASHWLEEKDYD